MLQEKKLVSVRLMNIVVEKDWFRKDLEIVESKNDRVGVERIKVKIKQFDVLWNKKGVDKKVFKFFEMNKKNRVENFKNVLEVKLIIVSFKVGEVGYDLFLRRWICLLNYYNGKNSGKDGGENEVVVVVVVVVEVNEVDVGGVEAIEVVLEVVVEVGKLIDIRVLIG